MSQRFLYIVPMSSREDRLRLNNAKIKLHFLFALYSVFTIFVAEIIQKPNTR